MCGICGFIQPSGFSEDVAVQLLEKMTDRVSHRGPDSSGHWVDGKAGVAFGHRRLSILDLSAAGNQPMESASGRFIIVFNGEIYNHQELRLLAGNEIRWKGHSDTESFLTSIEKRGIVPTLRASVGMFAFALWDRQDRKVTLGRDRLGEKPLYYGWQGHTLLFGSELKALHGHPALSADIDMDSVATYLKYGYVPTPFSIYKGINKVPPGSIVTIDIDDDKENSPQPETYWSLDSSMIEGARNPFDGSEREAVDELERVLTESVSGQLLSDVPLGAFLSGGIDSSTVVSIMQSVSATPVRTFTVGFNESERDESEAARQISRHLGTDHSELLVTPEDALAVIPRLADIYDEPFADASAVPTWLLAGLASDHVSVALSGDGGDELFAGYDRYRRTEKLWQAASSMPPFARSLAQVGLNALPTGFVQQQLMKHRVGAFPHLFSDRIAGLRTALASDTIDELYDIRMSQWIDPARVLIDKSAPLPTWCSLQEISRRDPIERMMAIDARSYMSDGVLAKVDRAAMSHSLETRVPLLDHRVIAFTWALPSSFRVRQNTSKWLLRQLLYRHIPPEMMDRPKKGFGVPLGAWLRGSLRPWAEELLTVHALEESGPFLAEPIRRLWDEHQSGNADWNHKIWPVLMYQAWAHS